MWVFYLLFRSFLFLVRSSKALHLETDMTHLLTRKETFSLHDKKTKDQRQDNHPSSDQDYRSNELFQEQEERET